MIGQMLGPYQVHSKLGEGGMGEVYKGRDTRLDRDVAIKILPAAFAGDADRLARFEREAKAVAALSHPNVIAVFDAGVHQQQAYVVMELLAGQTLRERLTPAALPVRKAVEIAVQIARGLGAAHGKGIVHRDLKPENIFLCDDGQVKILDFGLARQTGATADGAAHTVAATDPGMVMGTVGYMAPEQVRGQAVDARADVFALGVVLYEMVTGQRAFQRDTAADTMTAILTQEPPELTGSRPELSAALDRIIRHCLEKNPNERFQSARDIAFALEALSGSASTPDLSAATAVSGQTSPRRTRAALVLAAAVAGALVVGAGLGYVGRGRTAAAGTAVTDVTYKPVTFEEGFLFTARFAPDGRTVVYSADWDRQPRGVYITSLDSTEYRPLGFPGADLLGVSRSGELAILNGSTTTSGNSYWRLGTLARASLTGGAPRPELENVRFADFGPNNTMAVIRDDGRRQTMEYPVGQVLAEMASVKSGKGWMGRGDYAAPRVSPSGDHVAFFDISTNSAYRVRVFNRSGQPVSQSGPFADWWALAWTPSNEVWFAAAETSGQQTAIFGLDVSGHQRLVARLPGAITLHDISAAGDVLVSFDRGTMRIELISGSDQAPHDRSWREAGMLSGLSNEHTLLINGMGDSGGPQGSVYARKATEAQAIRIADGSGMALSPDGSKALVVSLASPPTISIVPTGPGQPRVVDIGAVNLVSWAGWLPDGRLVIQAVRSGSGSTVSVVSPVGRDPVALLPAGVSVRGHNPIAPDGSRIVARDSGDRLVLCSITPSACQPLPGTQVDDDMAGWAADGRSVFLFRPPVQVDRLEVASGRRVPWKTIRPLNPAVSGLGFVMVAPDGAIGYTYSRSRSELYVIKGLK